MSSAASDSKTEVGSYFISNYPPYSQWKKDSLDEVRAAMAGPPKETTPLGLYLHIPFCRKRCKFCYFKVFTDVTAPEVQRYVDALCNEISMCSNQHGWSEVESLVENREGCCSDDSASMADGVFPQAANRVVGGGHLAVESSPAAINGSP